MITAPRVHPSISVHAGRWLMSEIIHPTGRKHGRVAACADLVLETAVNGCADAIVTFNVFDFQRAKTLFGIPVHDVEFEPAEEAWRGVGLGVSF
jgi:hypothetical protein